MCTPVRHIFFKPAIHLPYQILKDSAQFNNLKFIITEKVKTPKNRVFKQKGDYISCFKNSQG